MSDIVTVANVKTYLGEAGSSFDVILGVLISAASEAIQNFLNRVLIETTYTSLELTGDGSSILYLPNWPTTTTALVVEEEGAILDEGEDEDFRLHGTEAEKGWLEKLSGGWSTEPKGIIVTYKAGYVIASIPKDLQFAAMHRIARMWKEQRTQGWGESSRTFPDGSINTIEAELFDKQELAILQKYKRVRI